MAYDPIVDEIHKVRERLAQRFNNNMHAIGNYPREQQKKSGRKVVDLTKKPKPPNEPQP
jgi:hypothetical protein